MSITPERLDAWTKLSMLLEEAEQTAIETNTSSKRREIGLDTEIDYLEDKIKHEEETIEIAYQSIRANLILIHETEGNINSRRALIALLETFRDELAQGTDVTAEYEEAEANEQP